MRAERYYLDTNILVFLIRKEDKKIIREVRYILDDYEVLLYTSVVCIKELVHLLQRGKIHFEDKKDKRPLSIKIKEFLDVHRITIVPVQERHVMFLTDLPLDDDHRDPEDRLIISQAIVDKMPLISSDNWCKWYVQFGLDLIFDDWA